MSGLAAAVVILESLSHSASHSLLPSAFVAAPVLTAAALPERPVLRPQPPLVFEGGTGRDSFPIHNRDTASTSKFASVGLDTVDMR